MAVGLDVIPGRASTAIDAARTYGASCVPKALTMTASRMLAEIGSVALDCQLGFTPHNGFAG